MTEPRDYVTLGQDRWPDASQTPNTMAYFAVFMQALMDDEEALLQVLDAFRDWHVSNVPTFTFVLELIGALIGQPRPAGFENEDYRKLLVARTIARISDAVFSDVYRLIDYLASINGGAGKFTLSRGVPEHWTIGIFDVDLNSQWQVLYAALIFDAIGAVDSFTLTIANDGAALYDDETHLYDFAIYS